MLQRIRFGLVLVVLLSLLACSQGGPTPTETVVEMVVSPEAPPTDTPAPVIDTPTLEPTTVETATPTLEPTAAVLAYGPVGFPAEVNPLTGELSANPALLNRRPVAVKIQMFPRSQRPPWGISQADIVFDYYQNFGMTRFHAIFYDTDAQTVGPVRSARLLDVDLVSMYQSIFAFGSAEQRTYSQLMNASFASRLILEGNGKCPPLCREDPNGSNYLVANTADLTAYSLAQGVDNTRPNLEGMSFNSQMPANGQPMTQIYVRYSISAYARWDFDPASGRYLRFQDIQEASDLSAEGYEPLVDRLFNTHIAADNVVVLIVPHQYAFNTHPGPSEVVAIGLQGSGTAYAFRNGQVYELQWTRPDKETVIRLSYADGTPYPFAPGNTWYQVVGSTTKIDNTIPGVVRFQHAIP